MEEVRLAPFTMTKEELIRLSWRRQRRAFFLLYLVYSMFIGALAAWLDSLILGSRGHSALVFLMTAIVVQAICIVKYRYQLIPKQVRKFDPIMFADRVVVMTEESCEWTYEGGLMTRIPWKLLRKAQVVEGIYLLFMPGGNFLQL